MSSEWIDISTPLEDGMVQWPGDQLFERTETLKIPLGNECNLSHFTASVHLGTHMDAPRHYLADGAGIDTLPLAATVGAARVIAIQDPELIRVPELEPYQLARGERVLFKTQNSVKCWNTAEFQKDFVYIPAETAAYLVRRGVQTVGIDYLSVGGWESDGVETHRILLQAGICIIEGLNLGGVEPGDYELVCLPLKLVGSDGAPARAILRRAG
jgi:arylformamidase